MGTLEGTLLKAVGNLPLYPQQSFSSIVTTTMIKFFSCYLDSKVST